MAIYSGFSHWKWWLSIVMVVYQRVDIPSICPWEKRILLQSQMVTTNWQIPIPRQARQALVDLEDASLLLSREAFFSVLCGPGTDRIFPWVMHGKNPQIRTKRLMVSYSYSEHQNVINHDQPWSVLGRRCREFWHTKGKGAKYNGCVITKNGKHGCNQQLLIRSNL